MFYYYHLVETTAGEYLVTEGIIRPVVSASTYTTISNIQFDKLTVNKIRNFIRPTVPTPSGKFDLSWVLAELFRNLLMFVLI